MPADRRCPDCEAFGPEGVNRRTFVRQAGAAAVAAAALPPLAAPAAAAEGGPGETPEQLVVRLYHTLTPPQREVLCFPWDHVDPQRGLLRTRISNNWNIVDRRYNVGGEFFTREQRDLIEAIFFGLYHPDWHDRIRKQLRDDAGGYGKAQTCALFGEPGRGKYQFVMTGRHCTIRCDGDSAEHAAFGGPIFYGHAAEGFNEAPDHPGNVFWPQALLANRLFQMLDGRQRERALANPAPAESAVGFRGPDGQFPGIPIAELSADQRAVAREVLASLVEPYRASSREEALRMLDAQGGLEACSLAFYSRDGNGASIDVGDDGVWDVWRIEGPSFVWHFRGEPHVHVWVNVADDPRLPLNADG